MILNTIPIYRNAVRVEEGVLEGANVLKILTRPRRERGIRGRDDGSVERGCGGVVDEKEVRYLEDEGVVGRDGW